MIKYTIREPTDKEISKSINVMYSAFGRTPPEDIQEEEKIWKALIELEIGKFLISEEKGKIFGVGGVFIFEKVSSFGYMAVLQEYRGKGIGTEIFRNLLEITNTTNCETRILYASKLGKPIYKKFGFQERFYVTMYRLPAEVQKLEIESKEIKVFKRFPKWLLNLDKKAMGFDRAIYLNMRKDLGANILAVENEGYGLIANKRLGPLVATNLDVALQIINKSITFGANHMIIAHHKYLPKEVFESVKLVKQENGANVKMVYGKEIAENLDLLYAIGTYAKG